MKRSISVFFAAALLAGAASATCPKGSSCNPSPPPTPAPSPAPTPSTSSSSSQSSSGATSSAGAISSSAASVVASPSSTSSATGGSVGPMSQSFEEFSKSNLYVLPAPAQAAPLPPGLCPRGDSLSIGILWNLFTYSTSSTRSEIECLERVLTAWRQAPKIEIVQAPPIPPAPAPAPAAAVSASSDAAPGVAPLPAAPAAPAPGSEVKKAAVAKAAPKKPAPAASKPKLELEACGSTAPQCKIPGK